MKKVMEYIKNAIAFLVGLGYWGISLIGWAILAGILGYWTIAVGLLCFFAGKNAQAIKENWHKIDFKLF